MGVSRFMAKQLRQPHGWFGSHVITRLMNFGNRRITETTLALLEVQPQHHVLEIGFGGGVALALLARQVRNGVICGVDFSADIVRGAERRFRDAILAGRLRVQLGDVSRLPYPDTSFDRILTVNTIYFWPDTLSGLLEIRRVLKPAGRIAIGIRSKEKMSKTALPQHGFRLFSADELAAAIQQAGFRVLTVDHRDQHKLYDQIVVLASF